jgi:hypothetical protein
MVAVATGGCTAEWRSRGVVSGRGVGVLVDESGELGERTSSMYTDNHGKVNGERSRANRTATDISWPSLLVSRIQRLTC